MISFHILAWLLIFLLPLLAPSNSQQQGAANWSHLLFNKVHIAFTSASIALFYLNAYFFVPRYFYRKKPWQYIFVQLISFVAFLVLITYFFQMDKNHYGLAFHKESFYLAIPFVFLWAMSTLFRFASDKVKTDQLLKEKENENLKTELSFLRSQVSPHFLFNVLNNMVALARLKSDRLEPSLIKLSGLMRYMLYESDEEKVPLSKEIEYVTSYIDLQRLRFGKEMVIHVDLEGAQGAYHLIEPMLLIPFIENAFKHGAGLIENPEIDISLKLVGDDLEFIVKNKFNGESKEIKDKTSGIGLANVMRRLNLLYDKRHSLAIHKDNGWFIVTLQLNLQ